MSSSSGYSLRAAYGGFSNPYGRIVEGNMQNSFGPFIDPELGRTPHLRPQVLTPRKKRRQQYQDVYM
jgi:hypothetical protein